MEICTTEKTNKIDFRKLNPGDCFYFNGGYYLKTKGINNCVNLASGEIACAGDFTKVVAVRAKIVVE